MTNGIIDLRKLSSSQQRGIHQAPSSPNPRTSSGDVSSPAVQKSNSNLDIQWSGYEHENRIRGRYWFVYLLIIAAMGIVFGVVNRNYLFIVFIIISFVMLIYYIKQPPRMRTYAIEKRGVWIDEKLTDYSKLKSFWIYTHPLFATELLLETQNPINPFIYIRLERADPDMVKRIIARYLPEREQKDAVSDQIARIIGF